MLWALSNYLVLPLVTRLLTGTHLGRIKSDANVAGNFEGDFPKNNSALFGLVI